MCYSLATQIPDGLGEGVGDIATVSPGTEMQVQVIGHSGAFPLDISQGYLDLFGGVLAAALGVLLGEDPSDLIGRQPPTMRNLQTVNLLTGVCDQELD